MENIEKKTTILLTPKLHKKLARLSKISKKSMGQLLREAAERQYFSSYSPDKLEIVKKIASLNIPIGDVPTLKAEIGRGRFKE